MLPNESFSSDTLFFLSTENVTFTNELSGSPVVATLGSVDELLNSVKLLMSENLVGQVGASYHFDINSEDEGHRRYYVDLSQGNYGESSSQLMKTLMSDVWVELNAVLCVHCREWCCWSWIHEQTTRCNTQYEWPWPSSHVPGGPTTIFCLYQWSP